MIIQPINLQINITTVLKHDTANTKRLVPQGPSTNRDRNLLKQIAVIYKRLDSAHFTSNGSLVHRNPEQQCLWILQKIRTHSMPTQHDMRNRKSQIVAGVARTSILTPSERVATQNSTWLRLSLLHSLASHQCGYCRIVQCPSEYVYLLQWQNL
jgi:hypothetical protein